LLARSLAVRPQEKVCVVLSGGNWNLSELAKVFGAGE
jgi:threonine dehydratase